MCEQYSSLNGSKYARALYACLSQALDLSINPHDKRIAQSGDLAQNSAVAQEIIDNLGTKAVLIPPRSPDLNTIENLFHFTGSAPAEDTKKKNFTKETFEEFSARVRDIMVNFMFFTSTVTRVTCCVSPVFN